MSSSNPQTTESPLFPSEPITLTSDVMDAALRRGRKLRAEAVQEMMDSVTIPAPRLPTLHLLGRLFPAR